MIRTREGEVMEANIRREMIKKNLIESNKPIKGIDLAKEFGVTRQIIVKDIAILRAKGSDILATPDGYIHNIATNRVSSLIAVLHSEEDTIEELEIVIRYGGIIEDVIIEHPLYGEIKGILKIKTLNDLEKFSKAFVDKSVKPLSVLTNGVHIHTISTETEEDMNSIKKELKEKGFLL